MTIILNVRYQLTRTITPRTRIEPAILDNKSDALAIDLAERAEMMSIMAFTLM